MAPNSDKTPSSSNVPNTTTTATSASSPVDENWIPYHSLDKARFTVLLAGASGLGSFLSHPFYVLTTRQQAGPNITGDHAPSPTSSSTLKSSSPSPSSSSAFSRFSFSRMISRLMPSYSRALERMGWRGLFRGWVPMAMVSIPSNVVYLTVIEKTREQVGDMFSQNYPKANSAVKDAAQAVYSGVVATFVYQIMFNPAEVLVSRMIIQNKTNWTSVRTTARNLYQEDRYGRAFFRGYSASFGTGLITSIIWWWAYSASRRFATSVLGKGENEAKYVDGFAGMCAGISETVLVHPFDSIRARIMTGASEERRFFRALFHVCQTEGFMILWRGLYPSMCHTLWSSTVFALAYELIKRNSPADAFAAFEDSLD